MSRAPHRALCVDAGAVFLLSPPCQPSFTKCCCLNCCALKSPALAKFNWATSGSGALLMSFS